MVDRIRNQFSEEVLDEDRWLSVQPEIRSTFHEEGSEEPISALGEFYERQVRAYESSSTFSNSFSTNTISTDRSFSTSFTSSSSSCGLPSDSGFTCATCESSGSTRGLRRCGFGTPGTRQHRLLLLDPEGYVMSPYDGVPLYHSRGSKRQRVLHCVCKTPRDTWAKYEVAETEAFRPLRLVKEAGRGAHFLENVEWNVSMLPQTWAEPTLPNESYGGIPYQGGHLEVLDIGPTREGTGEVYALKPLGALLVVDPNSATISWKIIGVAADAEMAIHLDDIGDVDRSLPGLLEAMRDWLAIAAHTETGSKKTIPSEITKVENNIGARKLIHEAHGWFRHCRKITSLSAPAPQRVTSSEFGARWQEKMQHEDAGLRIPASDPSKGSFARYERAWVETEEEDPSRNLVRPIPSSTPVATGGGSRARGTGGGSAREKGEKQPSQGNVNKSVPHGESLKGLFQKQLWMQGGRRKFHFSTPLRSRSFQDDGISFKEAERDTYQLQGGPQPDMQQHKTRQESSKKQQQAQHETPKRQQIRPETPKRQQIRPETPKRQQIRPETPKRQQIRPETPKQQPVHHDTPKRYPNKQEPELWHLQREEAPKRHVPEDVYVRQLHMPEESLMQQSVMREESKKWHQEAPPQQLKQWEEAWQDSKQQDTRSRTMPRSHSRHQMPEDDVAERFEAFALDTYVPQLNWHHPGDTAEPPRHHQRRGTTDMVEGRMKSTPTKEHRRGERGRGRSADSLELHRLRQSQSVEPVQVKVRQLKSPDEGHRRPVRRMHQHHKSGSDFSNFEKSSLDVPRSTVWVTQVAKSTATLERGRNFMEDTRGSSQSPEYASWDRQPGTASREPQQQPGALAARRKERKRGSVSDVSDFSHSYTPENLQAEFVGAWAAPDEDYKWHDEEARQPTGCVDPRNFNVASKLIRFVSLHRTPRSSSFPQNRHENSAP